MVDTAKPTTLDIVLASDYSLLYHHLRNLEVDQWNTTFGEIETILGFSLPPAARTDDAWWYNRLESLSTPQALAWSVADWFTFNVDLESETIGFSRRKPIRYSRKPKPDFNLDEILPTHHCGSWPEGLVINREFIYGDQA